MQYGGHLGDIRLSAQPPRSQDLHPVYLTELRLSLECWWESTQNNIPRFLDDLTQFLIRSIAKYLNDLPWILAGSARLRRVYWSVVLDRCHDLWSKYSLCGHGQYELNRRCMHWIYLKQLGNTAGVVEGERDALVRNGDSNHWLRTTEHVFRQHSTTTSGFDSSATLIC